MGQAFFRCRRQTHAKRWARPPRRQRSSASGYRRNSRTGQIPNENHLADRIGMARQSGDAVHNCLRGPWAPMAGIIARVERWAMNRLTALNSHRMGAQEIAETATFGGMARPKRFELLPPRFVVWWRCGVCADRRVLLES